MRLEEWRSLPRLLLCSPDTIFSEVQVLLKLLQQTLLTTEIYYLTLELWDFHSFQVELKKFSQDSPPFPVAIIFTQAGQSPYGIAYLCYLAGIPIRIGQSQEFGGGVLSLWVKPAIDPLPPLAHHLHLLTSVGLNLSLPNPSSLVPHHP